MTSFFKSLLNKLQLPSVILWLQILNFKNYVNNLFSTTKIYKNNEISSGKVALIALFEKGKIRNDVKGLLITLKNKGFNIVGVNTQKLDEEERKYFDLYVERFNYGRDFGSYKVGFLNLFKIKNLKLDKLLLLNDSIFYAKTNLENLIDDLCNESFDVIGATENFEIIHHIGSFCLSISSEIFTSKRFKSYWKKFRPTDIRPHNIKYGEMYLSKALFASAREQKKVKVLYDTKRYAGFLNSNDENVINFDKYTRKGTKWWDVGIGRAVVQNIIKRSASKALVSTMQFDNNPGSFSFDFDIDGDEYEFVDNIDGIKAFLKRVGISISEKELLRVIRQTLIFSYRDGSQIHQNFLWNLAMGCPILKNDLVYRNVISMDDIIGLEEVMEKEDFEQYSQMILSGGGGYETLTGFKRIAFINGYL